MELPEITAKGKPRVKDGRARNGRPKGAKNKSTLVREQCGNKFLQYAAKNFSEVYEKAFDLAKGGDQQMIKLVFDKLLQNASVEREKDDKGNFEININIGDLQPRMTIDAEDGEIIE
mgnify:CR=1 FL=1